jgi:hypothetical protein
MNRCGWAKDDLAIRHRTKISKVQKVLVIRRRRSVGSG